MPIAIVPRKQKFSPRMMVVSRKPGAQSYTRKMKRGRAGNIQTLEVMSELVRRDDGDLAIIDFANELTQGVSSHDPRHVANIIFAYVRGFKDAAGQKWGINYRSDPYGFEQVQDARSTIERGYGDCGDKAVLFSTLLSALGIKTRFVVLSYQPPAFQHVYAEAYYLDGWHVFDPTPEESIPGWQDKGLMRATWRIFTSDYDTPEGLSGFLSFIKGVLPTAASFIPGVGQVVAPLVGAGLQAADANKQQKAADKATGQSWDSLASKAADIFHQIQIKPAGNITPDDAAQAHQVYDQLESTAGATAWTSQQWNSAAYKPAFQHGLQVIDAAAGQYAAAHQATPVGKLATGATNAPGATGAQGSGIGGLSTTTLLIGGAVGLFLLSSFFGGNK